MKLTAAIAFLTLVARMDSLPLTKNSVGNGTHREDSMEDILLVNDKMNYFEGDIVFKTEEVGKERNAIKDENLKWTTLIPYEVHRQYPFEIRETINDVLAEFSVRMCVSFKHRENEANYLLYRRGSGCYSYVGEIGGMQEVSIGYGCESQGTIKHETMHALGFWHEQSRYDRDSFVAIMWENIQEGKEHNFDKRSEDEITNLDEDYDYSSIMHYSATAFSKNGEPTIVAVDNSSNSASTALMGQRSDFTEIDLRKLRKLYGCELEVDGWSEWTTWSECDRTCQRHRRRFCEGSNCLQSSETETEKCTEGCVEQDRDCPSRHITKTYGFVTSPLYPYNYKDSVDCVQTIGADNERVILTFESIDVEDYNGICYYDWVKVYDGPDTTSPLIGTYCGTSVPSTVTSSGSFITLRFYTDDSVNKRGFFANFRTTSPESSLHSCHFEGDIRNCAWSDDTSADFHWTRAKGSTPSSETGPSSDHTTSDSEGYYLFIETSAPVVSGMTARVLSPLLAPATGLHCLEFVYNMYGAQVDELGVYQVLESGLSLPVAYYYGNRGDRWIEAKITLFSEEKYQLIFEGKCGAGYTGDLAIDDVIILPGWCDYDGSGVEV